MTATARAFPLSARFNSLAHVNARTLLPARKYSQTTTSSASILKGPDVVQANCCSFRILSAGCFCPMAALYSRNCVPVDSWDVLENAVWLDRERMTAKQHRMFLDLGALRSLIANIEILRTAY